MVNSLRKNSLDPISLDGWRWAPFLDYAIKSLEPFQLQSYPINSYFLDHQNEFGSKAKREKAHTQTWAAKTSKFRQIRAACVEVRNFTSVLNFVVLPSKFYELPFFGADLVTLPSGHLLALDLQPAICEDKIQMSLFYDKVNELNEYWNGYFPNGGSIPEGAKKYFSPGFLWTRIPFGIDSDSLINNFFFSAFCDYLNLYIDLLKNVERVSGERSALLCDGQKSYLRYRSEKDPARGMLTRFYGSEWTESYINQILFPIIE